MNPSFPPEWHRLFNGALNRTLAANEQSRLAELLKSSADARRLWFIYHDNECGLAELPPATVPVASSAPTGPRTAGTIRPGTAPWWRSRTLPAAAVGALIGVCGASVLYGLALYRTAEKRTPLPIFAAGFEDESLTVVPGIPDRLGQWHGDPAQVVAAGAGVVAKEGRCMLRLEPPAKGPARLFQVLDLASLPPDGRDAVRELEVSAAVATASADTNVRFFIRAFAIAEGADQLDAAWFDRREEALAAVTRGLDLPPGTAGWQTLGITLPLPRHARSVVLFFGVRVPDKNARTYPFYLDDVRVTLVTSLAPP